jgi:hypothetical protein
MINDSSLIKINSYGLGAKFKINSGHKVSGEERRKMSYVVPEGHVVD